MGKQLLCGTILCCNAMCSVVLENDPRTVDNLLDGVNHTCDDLHAWLAPFTGGQNHFIHVEFDEVVAPSQCNISTLTEYIYILLSPSTHINL